MNEQEIKSTAATIVDNRAHPGGYVERTELINDITQLGLSAYCAGRDSSSAQLNDAARELGEAELEVKRLREGVAELSLWLEKALASARHTMNTSAHGSHVDQAGIGEDYLMMVESEIQRIWPKTKV